MIRAVMIALLVTPVLKVMGQNESCVSYYPENSGTLTEGNLSVGKFYKYSKPPLDTYPDIYPCYWSDGSKLTDEAFNATSETTSDDSKFVGWQGNAPVEIVIDLGRTQTVKQLVLNGKFRSSLTAELYTKQPDASWLLLGQKNTWSTGIINGVFKGSIDVTATQARYVKLILRPTATNGEVLLLDEITLNGTIKNTRRCVPQNGAFHGAFPTSAGFTAEEKQGRPSGMIADLFEAKVGKKLAMVLWYQNMKEGRNFSEIQTVRKQNTTRDFNGTRHFMFGWLPDGKTCLEIAQGSLDDYFKQYFSDAIDPGELGGIDAPIFFRPMNEFNGGWVTWGLKPDDFRKAWRRMYNVAEQIGAAQKHIFVWSPNFRSYPNTAANKMQLYYPGDQYVDWVGISAYPPGATVVPTEDERYPLQVVREAYDLYANYKPFMITEGAFSETCDRLRWTKEWFQLKDDYPNIKAVVWENHNDRIISLDEPSLAYYREKIQDPYWLGCTDIGIVPKTKGDWLGGDNLSWVYDMGQSTGSANSVTGNNLSYVSDVNNQTFLPSPPSGFVSVRSPSKGNPTFTKETKDNTPLLKITSGNEVEASPKFTGYAIPEATNVISIFFDIELSNITGNTDADWYFVLGNNGSLFNNGITYINNYYANGNTDESVYGAFKISKRPAYGNFFNFSARKQEAKAQASTYIGGDMNVFMAGGKYAIEMYANNTTEQQQYSRLGFAYNLRPRTYQLWVNGIKMGVDYPANALAAGLLVNSFGIMGRDPSKSGDVADHSAEIMISNLSIKYLSKQSLPVSIAYFKGKNNKGTAEIEWMTHTEQNNAYFGLQRSVDGKTYHTIAELPGRRNASAAHTYAYTDRTPAPDINYYRLQQTDINGNTNFWNEVIAIDNRIGAATPSLYFYNDNLYTSAVVQQPMACQMFITDLSGRKVLDKTYLLMAGKNEVKTDVSFLKLGVYVVCLKINGNKSTLKFVK